MQSNIESLSAHWQDLGNLDDYKFQLEDSIIPESKRNNSDIYQGGYWLRIQNQLYYFKAYQSEMEIIAELLGEEVSKYFKLPTVSYNLAKGTVVIKGKKVIVYGTLSPWARKGNMVYTTLETILPRKFNGLDILYYLEDKYSESPIKKQICALIVRDYITYEWDRLQNEILITANENKVELGFLADYEFEFFKPLATSIFLPGIYKLDLKDEDIVNIILQDMDMKTNFKKALSIPYSEYYKSLLIEKKLRINKFYQLFIESTYQTRKDEIHRKLSL